MGNSNIQVLTGYVTTTKTYYSYVIDDSKRGEDWSKPGWITLRQIFKDKAPQCVIDKLITKDKEAADTFVKIWKEKING